MGEGLRHVMILFGVAILAQGVVPLVGHIYDIPLLHEQMMGHPGMPPTTALAFSCVGVMTLIVAIWHK